MALSATVGVETSLDVWTAAGFTPEDPDNGPPDGGVPGLTWDQSTRTLDGTPTEAGEFSVTVWTKNAHNADRSETVTVTVEPGGPAEPDLTGEVGVETSLDVWTAAGFGPDSPVYEGSTPGGVPGLEWNPETRTLDGTPTEAGTFNVTVYTTTPFGDPVPETVVVTITGAEPDPDPDPDPGNGDPGDPGEPDDPGDDLDPWDMWGPLAKALGARVAAFVGHAGNEDVTATAEAQVPVVAEYVRGFTRGRGFRGEAPAGPLRAVIVSGVARLATNPEQVSHFQTGDYSERPAQLAGWTLAELGVLRRYRRVSA